jgi:hypothetical protein
MRHRTRWHWRSRERWELPRNRSPALERSWQGQGSSTDKTAGDSQSFLHVMPPAQRVHNFSRPSRLKQRILASVGSGTDSNSDHDAPGC